MKKIFLLILVIFNLCISCNSQNCKSIPSSFPSYKSATEIVKKSTFKITDNIPEGKSTWIKKATYYSCDGNYGFIIYITDKWREYIHQNVPLDIWNSFKSAASIGRYYDHNIKGRYKLIIK